MLERIAEPVYKKQVALQSAPQKATSDPSGTRRVMSGSRVINGKRYAFEVEVVACTTAQDTADTGPHVTAAVFDKVQEMLHKSLAAFAGHRAVLVPDDPPARGTEAHPGSQDYDGLIDCVIAGQRDTDLPGYLLDLAGNMEPQVGQAARVRERLVFVIAGQMIEADIEHGSPARAG